MNDYLVTTIRDVMDMLEIAATEHCIKCSHLGKRNYTVAQMSEFDGEYYHWHRWDKNTLPQSCDANHLWLIHHHLDQSLRHEGIDPDRLNIKVANGS